MSQSIGRMLVLGGLGTSILAGAIWGIKNFRNENSSGMQSESEQSETKIATDESSALSSDSSAVNSSSASGKIQIGNSGNSTSPQESTREKLENGQLNTETSFSRAQFFKPIDWGESNQSLSEKEKQGITFKPACRSHPRAVTNSPQPADWAESFTHTDSLSRWPSPSAHVVDWNQFWQVGDKGIQVSIRWNFELPPKYTVVGYSFALNNPDGYGAAIFPERPEMSWDEAKSMVVEWEKKTLERGGKLATRSMSVAEKPFNPAEVSTDEIERAEYSNSRIRAAQTGKMICHNSNPNLEELSCSCGF